MAAEGLWFLKSSQVFVYAKLTHNNKRIEGVVRIKKIKN